LEGGQESIDILGFLQSLSDNLSHFANGFLFHHLSSLNNTLLSILCPVKVLTGAEGLPNKFKEFIMPILSGLGAGLASALGAEGAEA
jgi:hypothetical protein